MPSTLHDKRFPGESQDYRAARDQLLEAEIGLANQIEMVAALRRALPAGGRVTQDYNFTEAAPGREGTARLDDLFAPAKRSLIVYSYMFATDADAPCPMCTSFLDGLDNYAPHVTQKVNLAIIAKAPAARLRAWYTERGWRNLRLLSSTNSSYNADYHGENADGMQMPMCNVFTRTDNGVHHFWGSEMLYAKLDGQPRHVDLLWPIWSFFDLTPEGRGEWYPQLEY